uniref:Uncharacterized protein n=1 Tax=Zea mays TaxID=4577 RepID=A0A804LPV0_MAIZE
MLLHGLDPSLHLSLAPHGATHLLALPPSSAQGCSTHGAQKIPDGSAFLLPFFFLKPAGRSLGCPGCGRASLAPAVSWPDRPPARAGEPTVAQSRAPCSTAPRARTPPSCALLPLPKQRVPFLAVLHGARRLFIKMRSKPRTAAALPFVLHSPRRVSSLSCSLCNPIRDAIETRGEIPRCPYCCHIFFVRGKTVEPLSDVNRS